jgi:pyrroloquinoline quinone (PQQ) biosynthesis protein C
MQVGHGQLLRLRIRLAGPLLDAATTPFWTHPRLADLFPLFLRTIHGSVSATVPLMQAAIDVLRPRERDRLASMLSAYFERHLVEETDHDEWLLQDLEALGMERQPRGYIPPPAIARMVGAQYYWIRHAHPVSLLGFFAVLEGHPPTSEHLEDIQQRTGLPSAAFRMLGHHAAADPTHADELFLLADSLPLEPWHSELMGTSALETVAAVCDVFQWLVTRVHPTISEAAAP